MSSSTEKRNFAMGLTFNTITQQTLCILNVLFSMNGPLATFLNQNLILIYFWIEINYVNNLLQHKFFCLLIIWLCITYHSLKYKNCPCPRLCALDTGRYLLIRFTLFFTHTLNNKTITNVRWQNLTKLVGLNKNGFNKFWSKNCKQYFTLQKSLFLFF